MISKRIKSELLDPLVNQLHNVWAAGAGRQVAAGGGGRAGGGRQEASFRVGYLRTGPVNICLLLRMKISYHFSYDVLNFPRRHIS